MFNWFWIEDSNIIYIYIYIYAGPFPANIWSASCGYLSFGSMNFDLSKETSLSFNSAILTWCNISIKPPSPRCYMTSLSSPVSKRPHNDTISCQLSLYVLVLLKHKVILKRVPMQWCKDLQYGYSLSSQKKFKDS